MNRDDNERNTASHLSTDEEFKRIEVLLCRMVELHHNNTAFTDVEDELCKLAKTCPDAFSRRIYSGGTNLPESWCFTLHYVCYEGASIETVKTVHQAFPAAVSRENSYRQLPIHEACAGYASLQVVQYLAKEYPQSLGFVDNLKKTPLHHVCGGLFCRYNRPAQANIAAFLLETHPEAATKKVEGGYTPLAYLMLMVGSFPSPAETFLRLLKAAPSATSLRNWHNQRPLDHAMDKKRLSTPVPKDVFMLLLEYTPQTSLCDIFDYPIYWTARMQALSFYGGLDHDENGCPACPLHAVLQCDQLKETHYVESVEHFRQHIGTKDEKGLLPLHIATAPSSAVPVRAVKQMVEMEPWTLLTRDPTTGLYPAIAMSIPRQKWSDLSNQTDILDLIYIAFRKDPALYLSFM